MVNPSWLTTPCLKLEGSRNSASCTSTQRESQVEDAVVKYCTATGICLYRTRCDLYFPVSTFGER